MLEPILSSSPRLSLDRLGTGKAGRSQDIDKIMDALVPWAGSGVCFLGNMDAVQPTGPQLVG